MFMIFSYLINHSVRFTWWPLWGVLTQGLRITDLCHWLCVCVFRWVHAVSCGFRSHCHCWFNSLHSFITSIDHSASEQLCTLHLSFHYWCTLFHQIAIHLFTASDASKQQNAYSHSCHSTQRNPLYPLARHKKIKCWCEEKGQSIVWRIYSICIHNCVQFTNSLFYNLVRLTAAGGQIMVGLWGANMEPQWAQNMMQNTKMMMFICPTSKSQILIIITTQKKDAVVVMQMMC